MEELKLAIAKRDTETVKKLFASKLASVGLFNIISEQQGLINKASDALSQILIPDDLVENNQHFVAVKTTGNGNCLYNATSLSISGNESLASELWYLCAAELYMNSASYANYQAFSSDDDFGMCLSGSAEKEAAIRNEAEETCNITPRPKWSNLIHIAALSNVIKRPVCSIYPDNFQWIHYNENEDKAYCHPCQIASRRRLIKSSKASQAFISTGFSNWNDAHRCFGKHEQSECHLEALQKLNVDKSSTDIGLAMVKQIGDVRENNRSCLMTILSNLQFLSRQGLPFRGSSDDSDSNFVQLNLLRCEDNPNFREWLTRKSDKYTSPDIQNEILKIMAQMIVREVSDNIRKSLYFALMADETTDVANKEQLVVCLRWIDQALDVHEDFIGLYQIDNTSAQTITDSIQDVLVRLNISLSQCRGQTYDGASAMSGPKSGVQKRIKDEQPKALYNHCHGHRLNLACSDNIKKTKNHV
ncbi:unnamed protein product [Mytilus edulis]|uniref:Uncharacterized protein n=1 Tax=Mytilus edulis TaxID=6550 RepID=A0A8S3RD85_MYTED|nr:unnamed protein product [Mytilus edulis]